MPSKRLSCSATMVTTLSPAAPLTALSCQYSGQIPSGQDRARGVEGLSAVSPHQHVSAESAWSYAPGFEDTTATHYVASTEIGCRVDRNWHRALQNQFMSTRPLGQRPTGLMCSAQVRTNDHKQENDNKVLSEPHVRRQTHGSERVTRAPSRSRGSPRSTRVSAREIHPPHTRRCRQHEPQSRVGRPILSSSCGCS